MANSKKRNKKYVPKLAVIPSVFALSDDELRKFKMLGYLSLDNLKSGKGNLLDWTNIIARFITGRLLVKEYFVEEKAKEQINEGLRKVINIGKRYNPNGITNWDITEEESNEIISSLNLIDEAQDLVSRKEYYIIHQKASKLSIADVFNEDVEWSKLQLKAA